MRAVVIGAGFAGLTVADALAWNGWDVTCVEGETSPGLGCSQASLGLVFPAGPAQWPMDLVQLTHSSFLRFDAFMDRLADRSHLARTEISTSGLLSVAINSAQLEEGGREAAAYSQLGISSEIIDGPALRDLEPALREGIGAVCYKDARYVNSAQFLEVLSTSFAKAGGQMLKQRWAVAITSEGQRATGVALDNDEVLQTDTIVLATGSSSNGLFPPLDAAISGRRGQWLLVRTPRPILRHATYIGELDLIPRADGSTMVGATQEGPGRRITTTSGVMRLLQELERFVCQPEEVELVSMSVGIRALTPDLLPIIGPSSLVDGVVLCAGLYKNGATLSPLFGDLIAECLRDDEWSSLQAFAPGRLNV